jgi:glucose dehydrogenase
MLRRAKSIKKSENELEVRHMLRIRISTILLSVCFATLALGQQPEGTAINNWSEFTHTNMHRWNTYEKTLTVQNVPNLTLKWSYSPGVPVFSSPAEQNNVVYAGAYDGNLYAWNATTGALLWSYFTEVGSWIYSSPAVANGVVHFSSVYPGVPRRDLCGQHQHRHAAVELPHDQRLVCHADSGRRCGVLRRL